MVSTVLLSLALACGGTEPLTPAAPAAIVSATLAIDSTTILMGHTAHGALVLRDADGQVISGKTVTWTSRNSSVAAVNAQGIITGIAAGSTIIDAASEGKTGSAPITITKPPAPPAPGVPVVPVVPAAVASVTVMIDSASLAPGHTARATAMAKDAAGAVLTGRTVTWTSMQPTIATVSAQGVVTAVAAGSATIQAQSEGKTGTSALRVVSPAPVTAPVVAPPAVASVTVMIDSASVAPGHTARATAIAKDAAGAVLTGRTVTWTSMQPTIATVSAQGVVTGVTAGSATIQALSEGKTGTATLRVVSATPVTVPVITDPGAGTADLASNNFESGAIAPYTNPWSTDIDVVDDPTGSNHGKVARIHYAGTNQDRNRALAFELPAGRGLGQSTFFKGDFYLPANINTSPTFAQRKLLYWQRDLSSNFPEFSSILTMFGTELKVNNVYVPASGPVVEQQSPVITTLTPGRWYTLETQLTLNSTFSARDGIFRIWLDGVLIYEKTDLTWSDPNWTNPQSAQRFRYFEVGDQVNSAQSFDEYRYWDNVRFGTRRITP